MNVKSTSTYTTTTTSDLHDEAAIIDPVASTTEDLYDIFAIPRPSKRKTPAELAADEDLIDLRSARSLESMESAEHHNDLKSEASPVTHGDLIDLRSVCTCSVKSQSMNSPPRLCIGQ
jgi:hypothetical protein